MCNIINYLYTIFFMFNSLHHLNQNSETRFPREECCERLAKTVNNYFEKLMRNLCPKGLKSNMKLLMSLDRCDIQRQFDVYHVYVSQEIAKLLRENN